MNNARENVIVNLEKIKDEFLFLNSAYQNGDISSQAYKDSLDQLMTKYSLISNALPNGSGSSKGSAYTKKAGFIEPLILMAVTSLIGIIFLSIIFWMI